MKKRFSMLPIFAFAASMFMLSACGDDDDSGSTIPQTPSYKIKNGNIVGVWRNGSDCFVSFSANGYNSALLSNTFIDDGDYTINGDTILVHNTYFANTTKYVVNDITNDALTVTITYKDRWTEEKTVKAKFNKAIDTPCVKTHALAGKSYLAQYAFKYGGQMWRKDFFNYNTASCTRQDLAQSTPSTFYYVYLAPKIYFYVIQYSMFYYDTVRYGTVVLDANNQIESMGSLYGEAMYPQSLY